MQERNVSLIFSNPDEFKENYDDVLKYLDDAIDTLDPVNKDMYRPKKTEARYMEYDPRTGEVGISTAIFDDMYWQQQYYNAVMRSSMNDHFKTILKEKGYDIVINDDEGNYKINSKKLQETVKENTKTTVERVVNDKEESLTASEKKVKKSMEKRAQILCVNIDNEKYRDELSDDRKFGMHLNICTLLNTNHDEHFIDKTYKELKVQNAKSNVTKIKLIHEVESMMNISTLCIDDIKHDFQIPQDKQEIIQKVFRLKEVSLISMYRNLIPGLIESKQVRHNNERIRQYEIDKQLLKYHLDLLTLRNKKLENIDQYTLNYFEYELKKDKRIV